MNLTNNSCPAPLGKINLDIAQAAFAIFTSVISVSVGKTGSLSLFVCCDAE